MADIATLFEQLGGATAIARALEVPVTTAHGWKRAGQVPSWRVPALVRLAKKRGSDISPDDIPQRKPTAPEQAAA